MSNETKVEVTRRFAVDSVMERRALVEQRMKDALADEAKSKGLVLVPDSITYTNTLDLTGTAFDVKAEARAVLEGKP